MPDIELYSILDFSKYQNNENYYEHFEILVHYIFLMFDVLIIVK